MKILSLSQFIPECFCDIIRFTGYHGDRNLSHYCGYASDFISQVLSDADINGAVFPKSCDSSRIMKSYLEDSGKFIYQFPVPLRPDETGQSFYSSVLQDFEHALCTRFPEYEGQAEKRIPLINQRNVSVKNIYDHIEDYSFYDFLHELHRMLSKPLSEQMLSAEHLRTRTSSGKRIYLIGSFLSNDSLIKTMEEKDLTVVGDYLPESGRLANAKPISTEGNLYNNIAEYILHTKPSPTQNHYDQISRTIMKQIRQLEAAGVVFITQTYCESYDYLYYYLKRELDAIGIPSLRITLSNSEEEGKSELLLEAFADIL